MATVELAACIPVVLLLLAAGLGAVDLARAKVACVDAAREGARAASRSDDAAGIAWASRIAPPGSEISVSRTGTSVTVTVTVHRQLRGVRAAGMNVSGTATALIEPDAPP